MRLLTFTVKIPVKNNESAELLRRRISGVITKMAGVEGTAEVTLVPDLKAVTSKKR